MPMWWEEKKNDAGEKQFALPKDIEDQIKAGAEGAKKIDQMQTVLDGLKTIMESDAESRKADREKAEATAAAARAREGASATAAELDELFITDPAAAVRKMTDPVVAALMETRADATRRELFEDTEKFPFYTGDIKREVDATIASQRLDFKVNPANLENAYHAVLGKHTAELLDGKLKKRFAGGENGNRGTSSGSAGSSGTGDQSVSYSTETMKDFEKAAKVTGMPVKDYIALYEKEGVV